MTPTAPAHPPRHTANPAEAKPEEEHRASE
jgi:hypothetical protein